MFDIQEKKPPRPKDEGCKIRIKNTSNGKQIEFSGKCSREQIEVARENIKNETENEE